MDRKIEQIVSIPLWIFLFSTVLTHWSMVKGDWHVKKLKRATYKEIKEKLLSVEWKYDPCYPHSLFDKHNYSDNYFHASIFRFGEVGYLLTPYGWLMANILQRKLRKTLPDYRPSIKPYVK